MNKLDKVLLPFDGLIGTLISDEFVIDEINAFIVEVPSTINHSFYTMTIASEKLSVIPVEPMGTTGKFSHEEAEMLSIEISQSLGDGYSTRVTSINNEDSYCVVGLWTFSESSFANCDQFVTSFASTRSWYLFQQVARAFCQNETDKKEAEKIEEQAVNMIGGYYDDEKEEWVPGVPSNNQPAWVCIGEEDYLPSDETFRKALEDMFGNGKLQRAISKLEKL